MLLKYCNVIAQNRFKYLDSFLNISYICTNETLEKGLKYVQTWQ